MYFSKTYSWIHPKGRIFLSTLYVNALFGIYIYGHTRTYWTINMVFVYNYLSSPYILQSWKFMTKLKYVNATIVHVVYWIQHGKRDRENNLKGAANI